MIARMETSDVKLKFLEVIEILEACGNLIYYYYLTVGVLLAEDCCASSMEL